MSLAITRISLEHFTRDSGAEIARQRGEIFATRVANLGPFIFAIERVGEPTIRKKEPMRK